MHDHGTCSDREVEAPLATFHGLARTASAHRTSGIRRSARRGRPPATRAAPQRTGRLCSPGGRGAYTFAPTKTLEIERHRLAARVEPDKRLVVRCHDGSSR